MWMSVRCRLVRVVLVWTHLAVFCALVRKDPNLTSLVLVARVSLFWTKRAGPFGWNQLLFHFKNYHFHSHHHDVNFELPQALIKTIDDPPMGKKFEHFSICSLSCSDTFCMFFLPKGIAFTQKTTAMDNRCGTFLEVGGNANSATTRE